MKYSKFIRWSGIVVVITAISILASDLIEDTPVILYGVTLIGALIGFVGIYQYQKDTAGVLSLISVIVLLFTFFFYGSGSNNLGDIAFPLAVLLLGIAAYQGGKFPRWTAGALILGVIVSLIISFLPTYPTAAGLIDSLIFTAGFGAMGYTLWTAAG